MINRIVAIKHLLIVIIWCCIYVISSYAMTNDTTQVTNTTAPTPSSPPVIIAPPKILVPGQHFRMPPATIYVPDYFHAKGNKVNLLIHFHGASWMVEQNFYPSGKNAVVVTVSLGGLSGVYTAKYKDPKEFGKLLNEVLETLDKNSIVHHPKLGRLSLTSFSAGFGAMREILQVPEYYKKINDAVFLDSIHAGLDTTTNEPPAEQMEMFLKFAKDAVHGKKIMWITHSQIDPITYASTTKTANYLINTLGIKQIYSDDTTAPNYINVTEPWKYMKLISTSDKGKFHVRGFYGDQAQDHMNHFYTIGQYITETSLPSILDK